MILTDRVQERNLVREIDPKTGKKDMFYKGPVYKVTYPIGSGCLDKMDEWIERGFMVPDITNSRNGKERILTLLGEISEEELEKYHEEGIKIERSDKSNTLVRF